ncbi:hypothetical protein C2G38_2229859 [Gigaspora rosea]|uniref:Uncharacterized protein n=1 Tax=Gigaspora rosea TaxID=44941 RepID=A0A397U3V9_9GLOM|nr:hypothetical protein C2G38_2229859 [Gigaspora rosea]
MSAIVTKIVEKYNLNPKMGVSNFSKYTSEFLENLTDDRKRNQARRRLRDGFNFSSEQVGVLIPNQRDGKNKTINFVEGKYRIAVAKPPKSLKEEIIREITKRILQNRYGFSKDQVDNLFSIQKNVQPKSKTMHEAFEKIDYPDHFTLESVKERLDSYDTSSLPDLKALADVMIMLCIRPAELITLRITNAGVTGYAKNRGQANIPRKFRSMEKNQERAKELLTWIQHAISSGRMGNPGKPGVKWFNRFLKDYGLIPKYLRKMGAVYGVVIHEAKNMAHAYTISRECLRHSSDNHTSPVQNYVVVNYRRKGQSPDQARPFQIYDGGN